MQLEPLVRIRTAKLLTGFRIKVEFEDGSQREIDLEPYLHGPVFELMRNPTFFGSFIIERGVITWPNGADIDPDVLYYGLRPAWMEEEEAATEEPRPSQK